jgi:hypothetical protein
MGLLEKLFEVTKKFSVFDYFPSHKYSQVMFLSLTVTLYCITFVKSNFVYCLSLTDPIIKKVPLSATGTAQLVGIYTEYLYRCQLFRLQIGSFARLVKAAYREY